MADAAQPGFVDRLQQRRAEAWAEVYDLHAPDLFAFVVHLLGGDRISAEEIHQEVWLAALSGIETFDAARGELRGWIFGIARRQVALHLRRRSQTRLEFSDGSKPLAENSDRDAILPLDAIGLVERADAVRAALVELGAESREVLRSKYLDGQSVNQLAARLGRTPKAIESMLSRARRRMRSLLAWYFDAEKEAQDQRK
jgi:RNA polymerase sigma-70 factor (ECF subfamily)